MVKTVNPSKEQAKLHGQCGMCDCRVECDPADAPNGEVKCPRCEDPIVVK